MRREMRRRDLVDDDDIVRDGERVRCPLYLMDSVQRAIAGNVFDARSHQPHFATDAASERIKREARVGYIKQLTDSWKRTPTKDASEPDAAERLLTEPDDDPNERMRRHLYGGEELNALAKNIAARREREHQARCQALSEAWRSPTGNASVQHPELWSTTRSHAASAIEEQRRRWTAER
jgi:hypothetical protein